jgi:hypothetical protein
MILVAIGIVQLILFYCGLITGKSDELCHMAFHVIVSSHIVVEFLYMSGWVTSGPFGVMLIIVGFHSHHPELNSCILDMDCLLIWILVICVDCKKGSACDHRDFIQRWVMKHNKNRCIWRWIMKHDKKMDAF